MLDLREGGFSGQARYQFDRAVASLSRRIETRLAETDQVQVEAPKQPLKGHVWSHKPRFTLGQLLYDSVAADGTGEDEVLPEFADLPAAML